MNKHVNKCEQVLAAAVCFALGVVAMFQKRMD